MRKGMTAAAFLAAACVGTLPVCAETASAADGMTVDLTLTIASDGSTIEISSDTVSDGENVRGSACISACETSDSEPAVIRMEDLARNVDGKLYVNIGEILTLIDAVQGNSTWTEAAGMLGVTEDWILLEGIRPDALDSDIFEIALPEIPEDMFENLAGIFLNDLVNMSMSENAMTISINNQTILNAAQALDSFGEEYADTFSSLTSLLTQGMVSVDIKPVIAEYITAAAKGIHQADSSVSAEEAEAQINAAIDSLTAQYGNGAFLFESIFGTDAGSFSEIADALAGISLTDLANALLAETALDASVMITSDSAEGYMTINEDTFGFHAETGNTEADLTLTGWGRSLLLSCVSEENGLTVTASDGKGNVYGSLQFAVSGESAVLSLSDAEGSLYGSAQFTCSDSSALLSLSDAEGNVCGKAELNYSDSNISLEVYAGLQSVISAGVSAEDPSFDAYLNIGNYAFDFYAETMSTEEDPDSFGLVTIFSASDGEDDISAALDVSVKVNQEIETISAPESFQSILDVVTNVTALYYGTMMRQTSAE